MRRSSPILLLILVLLPVPFLHAQRGHGGGRGFSRGISGFAGFSNQVYPLYAPSFGYGGFGYGFGPTPALPPGPIYPEPGQSGVYVAEATHDWRFWSPPVKIVTGPIQVVMSPAPRDPRVIGMGIPTWTMESDEPLGDIARYYRAQAARANSENPGRVVLHIRN